MSESRIKKGKAKKDSGIAVLPNGVRIAEETRDAITAHCWAEGPRNKARELTTSDCVKERFSGYRYNIVSHYVELWIMGQKAGQIHENVCTPRALATMHEEVFATCGSVIEIPIPVPGQMEGLRYGGD